LKNGPQLSSPPIGLSVYDMYGKSESEQTLIGGDTGRDSDTAGGDESFNNALLMPVVAIVVPLCKRAVFGRVTPPLLVPGKFWCCDCSEPIFGASEWQCSSKLLIYEFIKFKLFVYFFFFH
jgi:hypothetical protein